MSCSYDLFQTVFMRCHYQQTYVCVDRNLADCQLAGDLLESLPESAFNASTVYQNNEALYGPQLAHTEPGYWRANTDDLHQWIEVSACRCTQSHHSQILVTRKCPRHLHLVDTKPLILSPIHVYMLFICIVASVRMDTHTCESATMCVLGGSWRANTDHRHRNSRQIEPMG